MSNDYADNYPEHEKLLKISDFSQKCGEFVDWLQTEKGILLAVYDEKSKFGDMYRATTSIESLLAEFFDIDQRKLEAEKRAMLDAIRAAHAEKEATP